VRNEDMMQTYHNGSHGLPRLLKKVVAYSRLLYEVVHHLVLKTN
jgi:hypothetical protein